MSNRHLNYVANAIYRQIIPMDDDQRKRNLEIVSDVTSRLLRQMKAEDPVFASLFMKVDYTGSYWGGLRIGEATEFDLNIALKIPFQWTLERGRPGYAKLFIETIPEPMERTHPLYDQWILILNNLSETDGPNNPCKVYLHPELTRSWIEGLVSKAVNKDVWLNRFVKVHKTGPAFTFKIAVGKSIVDMDIVPSIYLQNCRDLLYTRTDFQETWQVINTNPEWRNKDFALIPKPVGTTNTKIKREWSLDFKDLERDLVEGQTKPMIKLLKAFRDSNAPIQKLFSYALKTVVLNQVKKTNVTFKEENRGSDFITTLRYLLRCLGEEKIPNYWDHRHNLIGNFKPDELANMRNWLERAIKDLEAAANATDCETVWWSYFGKEKDLAERLQGWKI